MMMMMMCDNEEYLGIYCVYVAHGIQSIYLASVLRNSRGTKKKDLNEQSPRPGWAKQYLGWHRNICYILSYKSNSELHLDFKSIKWREHLAKPTGPNQQHLGMIPRCTQLRYCRELGTKTISGTKILATLHSTSRVSSPPLPRSHMLKESALTPDVP